MSELAARHLIHQGAASILVTNRTHSRAEKIAADFASSAVHTEAIPFDDLYAQAPRADIVITTTGAPQKIFSRSHGQQFLARRRNRPMFFIDIAVPRDVDPSMNEVEGCFVYDIDDLQQVAAANLADRSREAAAAETIVSREVDKYQRAPSVPRRRPRHHGAPAASRSAPPGRTSPHRNRNSPPSPPSSKPQSTPSPAPSPQSSSTPNWSLCDALPKTTPIRKNSCVAPKRYLILLQ